MVLGDVSSDPMGCSTKPLALPPMPEISTERRRSFELFVNVVVTSWKSTLKKIHVFE
ncbi:hypothetical protein DPMN_128574 [Dreissena polymorpha]|uniref:Uncharacterized protein n=1 Tax=Dreissena polymorpha TaxID=45954 RepID=A0A9D4H383_DREPO|nr:hypothetical protein DPMN_128574 [Dreissena polymorpha]